MFNKFRNLLRVIDPKRSLLLLLAIVAIFGALGSYYFYSKYQSVTKDPNLKAQRETEAMVSALGKLMELPQGETPTIATITDNEKLKNQPFFKTSENGDRLFAYNTAKIAILYRPRTNKIINVSPISVSESQDSTQSTGASTSQDVPPRIAYYNGTETVGLSGLAEKTVKEKYPTWHTATLSNATRKDYKETIVVDLSGHFKEEASNLAGLLNGKVALMSPDELRPDADILIISGQ